MGAIAPTRPVSVWRELVAGYEESGLSQLEFARRRGLKTGTFSRWCSRIRRERARLASRGFVEVTVAPAEACRSVGFIVELAHVGHRVQIPSGFDAGDLRRLVQALS
jgi:hypothetical protein